MTLPAFVRVPEYPAQLEQAWQAAKAPRASDAPTVISTFSGRGGSSIGYHMAGFRELLAVEWDGHAADTLRLNWPDLDVYHGDIAALGVDEVLSRAGLRPGELDLFEGSPPCFPAGSLVTTERGSVAIEELQVGDRVLTHLGRYQRVEEVMARPYVGKLLTITTKYGRTPVTATPEHPFWARKRLSVRSPIYAAPEWMAASDLRPGDLLCEPHAAQSLPFSMGVALYRQLVNVAGQSGRDKREIRLDQRPVKLDWTSPDVAWLIGLYLAEGHTRGQTPTLDSAGPNRREVVFSVATHEAEGIQERLNRVGLHGTVTPHSQSVSRVSVASVDFWLLCQECGKGAGGKFIPEPFQAMPKQWKRELLNGYFEGDGCVYQSKRVKSARRKATTISRRLAEGIARMVASAIGIVATLERLYTGGERTIQGRRVTVQDAYSVGYALSGSGRTRPAFTDEQGAWIPIRTVSEAPTVPLVYNLEVEQDHSYTVGGFAVHNCQGFSTAGRRQIDDPRNQLFREYVRLLAGLQPKTFIMENVEGMTFGSMAGIYGEALGALQDAGYVVVSGVLNAGYLGVPQLRKRLIVIGVREDLGLPPTLPVPMQKPITVREAWHGLPDTPEGFTLTRPEWLTVYARTAPGRSFKDLHPNKAFFSHVRLSYDRPSPTIVKTIGVSRSGEPHGGFFHPRWPRLLTIPEAKRLSSFPDAYRFAETGDPVDDYLQAWAGLGNSVPPLMTRAIAQHLRATVLDPLSGA